jgi:hypothetical protein
MGAAFLCTIAGVANENTERDTMLTFKIGFQSSKEIIASSSTPPRTHREL